MNSIKEFAQIKQILQCFYSLEENPTYIFGSRVSGEYRVNSDLDIMIDDQTIDYKILPFIQEQFELSNIPYKVDISLKSQVNVDFFDQIKSSLSMIV